MNEQEKNMLYAQWYRRQIEMFVDTTLQGQEPFDFESKQTIVSLTDAYTSSAYHMAQNILRRHNDTLENFVMPPSEASLVIVRKLLHPITKEPDMRIVQTVFSYTPEATADSETAMLATLGISPAVETPAMVIFERRDKRIEKEAKLGDLQDYWQYVRNPESKAPYN